MDVQGENGEEWCVGEWFSAFLITAMRVLMRAVMLLRYFLMKYYYPHGYYFIIPLIQSPVQML